MLGEMLHHRFFRIHEYWYYRKKLEKEHNVKSLSDFRKFLDNVAAELEEANKGHILAYPSFFELMERSRREEID